PPYADRSWPVRARLISRRPAPGRARITAAHRMPTPSRKPSPQPAPRPQRPLVAVLGIGQMGMVCSSILAAGQGVDVVLWGHNAEEAGALAQTRRSPRRP